MASEAICANESMVGAWFPLFEGGRNEAEKAGVIEVDVRGQSTERLQRGRATCTNSLGRRFPVSDGHEPIYALCFYYCMHLHKVCEFNLSYTNISFLLNTSVIVKLT